MSIIRGSNNICIKIFLQILSHHVDFSISYIILKCSVTINQVLPTHNNKHNIFLSLSCIKLVFIIINYFPLNLIDFFFTIYIFLLYNIFVNVMNFYLSNQLIYL